MQHISVSSLNHFSVCARKRAFLYSPLHMRTYRGNLNLLVGSLVHEFLAEYYKGDPDERIMQRLLAQFDETVQDDPDYPFQQVDRARDILERILFNYPTLAVDPDDDLDLESMAVETKFKLPFTDGTEIVGVIDLVARTNVGHMIIDHKTAASCSSTYFYDYENDLQTILYSWAARELGLRPKFFGVNVISKTKETYVRRHFVPLDWSRIDRQVDNLRETIAETVDPLPTTLNEILELPLSIVDCRRCQFATLCYTTPEKAAIIANSHFVTERRI